MARYPCEMFAHFYYSPKLSYEELHQKEEDILQQVSSLLTRKGAIHLDFVADSDSLAVQCEFDNFDQKLFSHLAEDVKHLLPHDTEGRILFVDKENLAKIYIYSITPKTVEEREIPIKTPFTE